jgi:hypothetical protein
MSTVTEQNKELANSCIQEREICLSLLDYIFDSSSSKIYTRLSLNIGLNAPE